ncbi:hypothetical protein AAES_103579 [Amazona aestiva]|uniref:Uncharacterized protein n=1 Tax=Amazona aestiva TaxID=12930 RepID=A0A0Q3URX0_AMAAE|nr:hypothetical protein AAES_103579 [Amazona aestiva]
MYLDLQVKSCTPSFDKAEDGSDYPLVHIVVKGRGSNRQDFGWFALPAKADIPRHGYACSATKLIFSIYTCTIKGIHSVDGANMFVIDTYRKAIVLTE